jgi:hypothetical protein
MADGLQIAPESTGPTLDTKDMGSRGHREITCLGDPTVDAGLQKVVATDPGATDYGAVVRQALPISPRVDVISVTLGAGGTDDIDSTVVSGGTTGKLRVVRVGSSIPCKWTLQIMPGAVSKGVIYTSGLAAKPSDQFDVPKGYIEAAAAGFFRVVAVALDDSDGADATATFIWDEVS